MNLPKLILRRGLRDLPTKATLKKYELSAEDYQKLAKDQDYRCALCGQRKPLVIDHDHKVKGRAGVRGLLCVWDNGLLGCFKDDAAKLDRTAAYLRRPKPFATPS